jgi:hypothetical protein
VTVCEADPADRVMHPWFPSTGSSSVHQALNALQQVHERGIPVDGDLI